MNSRRSFLQKITASGLALPLLSSVNVDAKADTKTDTTPLANREPYQGPVLKVAIMGLGGYGERVAEAMQSSTRAKLTGVISGTPSKIKTWQSKYGIPEKNCYNYENFDAIKNNP